MTFREKLMRSVDLLVIVLVLFTLVAVTVLRTHGGRRV
jgi:hypothetical protein